MTFNWDLFSSNEMLQGFEMVGYEQILGSGALGIGLKYGSLHFGIIESRKRFRDSYRLIGSWVGLGLVLRFELAIK